MIISAFYIFCFIVLLLNTDISIRLMSVFGIIHISIENMVYYWYLAHPNLFELNLYLTGCWFLDILLLFSTACILKGWRKKLTLSIAIPVLFLQMLTMQYPFLIPGVFDFVINSSYSTTMEMIILCASFKDNTITEWIKTVLVISSLIFARILPLFLH